MKILALEREIAGVSKEQINPNLKKEAAQVWKYYQEDIIREIYFRQDWPGAVLVLECKDIKKAHEMLNSLPLVKKGLIDFEVFPLAPYPGYSRLFSEII
jgi:hypothetical protein